MNPKIIWKAVPLLLSFWVFQFGQATGAVDEADQARPCPHGESEIYVAKFLAMEYKKNHQPDEVARKINPQIRSLAAAMSEKGITRENAKQRGAADLSTSSLRVSPDGKIQTYIHIDGICPDKIKTIEGYQVIVDITNHELGILQAWVPFDKIYDLARLDFVKRISTPDYPIGR